MMEERILIVRVAALGDIVSTTVLLARIRAERPQARVTWLCSSAAIPIVELFDGVDEIIGVDESRLFTRGFAARARETLRIWRRLAFRRFDLALIAHRDARYRLLVAGARIRAVRKLTRVRDERTPPLRVRFWGDEYARLLDDAPEHGPVPRRYTVADVRDRLRSKGLGAVRPPAASTSPRVALVPAGARNALRDDPHRRWPVEHYVAAARALVDAGCSIVLVGGGGDTWASEQFAGIPVEDHIGRTSLHETLALLEGCDLVITHDTGPLHLARLVRARILALFGPTTPLETVGVDPTITVLWGGEELSCRPCYDGIAYAPCDGYPCISEIRPEIVVRTALSLLRRAPEAAAAR